MKELSAQQLSAVDGKQKVYYLLDFNETTKKYRGARAALPWARVSAAERPVLPTSATRCAPPPKPA